MSTATAEPTAAAAKGGKKKLIIIIAAVLLLVIIGGGAAALLMKKSHADDEEDPDAAESHGKSHAEASHAPMPKPRDPSHPPVFVPLDQFTVNLADRDVDRYALVGVTLEIDDAKTGELIKQYMPAIRNNILMVLSNKTAAKLLSRDGKEKLAQQILLASVQPLGYPVDLEDDDEEEDSADAPPTTKKKKKKKKAPRMQYPVLAVHYSSFVVQ